MFFTALQNTFLLFIGCLTIYISSSPCVKIKPSSTDPLIDAWDDGHVVCSPNTTSQRNQLLIFLPGTTGIPGKSDLVLWAQTLGFHVINLNYPNNVTVGSRCRNDSDVDCHWKLRNETMFGINYSPHANLSYSNCIVNRLNKLLLYLSKSYPTQNWQQFIADLSKRVVTGSSQGSSYALFMGKYFSISRVVMFNGSEDSEIDPLSPLGFKSASWITSPFATDADRIFGFNSIKDRLCQTSENNYISLQLPGSWFSIDDSKPLDTKSHKLCTSQCPKHGCVTKNQYSSIFKPVWTYLFTYNETQRQQNVKGSLLFAEGFPSGPCECSGPPKY